MLTQNDYLAKCANMGIKNPRPYLEYQNYERLWEVYIKKIVLPKFEKEKPSCVRLILCESCPVGKQNPNPNYIFDNLTNPITYPTDIYLDQIWKGIHQKSKLPAKKTKGDALKDLVDHKDGPVVILDILPSHGINMVNYRKKVDKNPQLTVDIDKIRLLMTDIQKYCPKIVILATFATPPNTTKTLNVPYTINPTFIWFLPTINPYPNGYTPKWEILSRLVDNGFNCKRKIKI